MPVVVSLVGSDRIEVREAARRATARFGRNAIWQLRERYEAHTGRRAERSWGWERTARALYEALDRPRNEASEAALAAGQAALAQGDLEKMAAHYDSLLRRDPRFDRRARLAPGYATLGRQRLAEDALAPAEAAFARALWLAPEHPDAGRWRAQLAYARAERHLTRGVADLDGYASALAHDATHTGARDVLSSLRDDPNEGGTRARRWAGFAAVGLLGAFGLLVLRRRAFPFGKARERLD